MRSNRRNHVESSIGGRFTPTSQYHRGAAAAQRSPASASKGPSPPALPTSDPRRPPQDTRAPPPAQRRRQLVIPPGPSPFAERPERRVCGKLIPAVDIEGAWRRLRFGKQLGKGGQAVVFAVEDTATGEPFAAKFFKPGSESEEAAEHEIEILRRLDHPNVLKLHGAFTYRDEGDVQYRVLLLELCRYGSLYGLVARQPLTAEEAQYVTAQLVRGLSHLRSMGVFHRDLKLANILIDDHLRIKIADFGLATTLTETNEWAGTPNYMALEVLDSPIRSYNYRADLWALGIIVYALFHRIPPFQLMAKKPTYEEVIAAIRRGEYKFLAPEMPPEARDFVAGLLQHDPASRLNFTEMRAHAFLAGEDADDGVPPDSMIARFAAVDGVTFDTVVGRVYDAVPVVEEDSFDPSEPPFPIATPTLDAALNADTPSPVSLPSIATPTVLHSDAATPTAARRVSFDDSDDSLSPRPAPEDPLASLPGAPAVPADAPGQLALAAPATVVTAVVDAAPQDPATAFAADLHQTLRMVEANAPVPPPSAALVSIMTPLDPAAGVRLRGVVALGAQGRDGWVYHMEAGCAGAVYNDGSRYVTGLEKPYQGGPLTYFRGSDHYRGARAAYDIVELRLQTRYRATAKVFREHAVPASVVEHADIVDALPWAPNGSADVVPCLWDGWDNHPDRVPTWREVETRFRGPPLLCCVPGVARALAATTGPPASLRDVLPPLPGAEPIDATADEPPVRGCFAVAFPDAGERPALPDEVIVRFRALSAAPALDKVFFAPGRLVTFAHLDGGGTQVTFFASAYALVQDGLTEEDRQRLRASCPGSDAAERVFAPVHKRDFPPMITAVATVCVDADGSTFSVLTPADEGPHACRRACYRTQDAVAMLGAAHAAQATADPGTPAARELGTVLADALWLRRTVAALEAAAATSATRHVGAFRIA